MSGVCRYWHDQSGSISRSGPNAASGNKISLMLRTTVSINPILPSRCVPWCLHPLRPVAWSIVRRSQDALIIRHGSDVTRACATPDRYKGCPQDHHAYGSLPGILAGLLASISWASSTTLSRQRFNPFIFRVRTLCKSCFCMWRRALCGRVCVCVCIL